MILQSLVHLYDELSRQGKVAKEGWGDCKSIPSSGNQYIRTADRHYFCSEKSPPREEREGNSYRNDCASSGYPGSRNQS